MTSVLPPSLPRRALLRALVLGGAVTVLAGCEEDPRVSGETPGPPVVPDDPATWPVDSELLLEVRARVHDTLSRSRLVNRPGRALRSLQVHWQTQLDRLEELVVTGGVPLPELAPLPPQRDDGDSDDGDAVTATASTGGESGGDDAATTSGPPADRAPTPAELAEHLRGELPAFVEQIAAASPLNLPMLVSLVAHQGASAARLGAPVAWEPLAGPQGAAAVPLLAVTRPAIFGLEVVAARSRGEERAGYENVLEEVRSITRQLTSLAGEAAPVAPLGYDLPEPLDDEDSRRELARALVGDIAPAALRTADRVLGRPEELTSLVRVIAESVPWSGAFGAPGEAFPGMTLP